MSVSIQLPADVKGVPGMTTEAERLCLYRAALALEPVGQVVDLGCWLGSLTAALASGVRDNPRLAPDPPRIYAYDTFVWQPWMDAIATQKGVTPLPPGESFLPLFEDAMTPWRDWIEVRAGDAAAVGWTGESIALLSIDAMKDPATARGIVRQFYPSLIPGRSIVFQQDFAHYYTTWVHLLQWRMRDHCKLIEAVPWSGGILFTYDNEILPEDYDAILDFEGATDTEWEAAFAFSRSLVGEENRERIAAAEIMRFLHEKRYPEARSLAKHYEAQGLLGQEFGIVQTRPEWQKATEER